MIHSTGLPRWLLKATACIRHVGSNRVLSNTMVAGSAPNPPPPIELVHPSGPVLSGAATPGFVLKRATMAASPFVSDTTSASSVTRHRPRDSHAMTCVRP